MEKYETPQMEIKELVICDIIATSDSEGILIDGGYNGEGDSSRW